MKVSPFAAVNTQAAAAVIAVFLVFAVLFGSPDAPSDTDHGAADVSVHDAVG